MGRTDKTIIAPIAQHIADIYHECVWDWKSRDQFACCVQDLETGLEALAEDSEEFDICVGAAAEA